MFGIASLCICISFFTFVLGLQTNSVFISFQLDFHLLAQQSTLTFLSTGLIWKMGKALRRKVLAVSLLGSIWSSGPSSISSWTLPTTLRWVPFASNFFYSLPWLARMQRPQPRPNKKALIILQSCSLVSSLKRKEKSWCDSDVQGPLRASLHPTWSGQLLTMSTSTHQSMTASPALTSPLMITEFLGSLLMCLS